MGEILIRAAIDSDMEKILHYLQEFRLDSENISSDQFVVATVDNNLAGFGRIKSYGKIYELSSVGVVKKYRQMGIGKKIIEHLIDNFPTDQVWIATKITNYFRKFGFKETDNPPDEIREKRQRICANVCGSVDHVSFMILKKQRKEP